MKLVSIVVPIFNTESYLSQCIESLISQNYNNIEIILVDDGSTDGSSLICNKYVKVDSRVRYFFKKNGGLSSARNFGISHSAGDYIVFVDSDDYLGKSFVSDMVNEIEENNVDIVISNIIYVDENGVTISGNSPIIDEHLSSNDLLKKLTLNNYYYYVCSVNKLYKRKIFQNVVFKEGKIHEDELFLNSLINNGYTFSSISSGNYFYRQTNGSIMHRKVNIQRLDAVDAFIERAMLCKKAKLEKNYVSFCYQSAASCYIQCINNVNINDNFWVLLKYFFKVYRPLKIRSAIYKIPLLFVRRLLRSTFDNYLVFLVRKKTKRLAKKYKKIVYILGTPTHGNMGDQAIVFAETLFLKNCGISKNIIEINNDLLNSSFDKIIGLVNPCDLVVIDGGGNLGTLWPWENDKIIKIIKSLPNSSIIVFPQTCFYEKEQSKKALSDYNKIRAHKKLKVFLRDKQSFDYYSTNFKDVDSYLVPDIVFSLPRKRRLSNTSVVLVCLRNDRERLRSFDVESELLKLNIEYNTFSTILNKRITKKNRAKELTKLFDKISSSKLVITDRMHALIFSYICNVPCLVIDNISKKVTGALDWILNNQEYCIYSKNALIQFERADFNSCDKVECSNMYDRFADLECAVRSWNK